MRDARYRNRLAVLARDFAGHELLKCDEISEDRAILRIGRPGCSIFMTEIAISLSHVVLWGDIETCAFMGWDNGPWRAALKWLGARSDWHYLQSKASQGTGWDAVRTYSTTAAKSDILRARRDGNIDRDPAREAWDCLANGGSAEQAGEALLEAGVDAESCDIGEVLNSRVLCAVAAIRRAHELVNGGGQ
jgi:hypothetical protein